MPPARRDVWVGTTSAGLFEVGNGRVVEHTDPLVKGRGIACLYADREGRVWIALTQHAGLVVHDGTEFSPFSPPELDGDNVRAVTQSVDGSLWFAMETRGVYRNQRGRLQHFGGAQGLSTDLTLNVVADRAGHVWTMAPSRGRRVLLVDDNAAVRRAVADQLRRAGALPDEAATASDALARIGASPPGQHDFALALVDRGLPDMDGMLLAEALAANARFAGTPVVLMTSAPHPPNRTLDERHGVRATLQKPVREVALSRAIDQALAPPDTTAHAAPSAQPAAPLTIVSPSAPLRILVVEDNPVNQKVAVRLVQKLGHVTAVAKDGVEGLAAMQASPFDLVLMDCQMPEMDGYQATRVLRERERKTGTHLPVVALTANVLCEEREQCRLAGMDDFLSKPVRVEELAAAIARWTGKAGDAPPALRTA